MESCDEVSGETELTSEPEAQQGGVQLTVCNVCHLEYEGEECPWCKAEREHASGVIEERGRRSRRLKEDVEGSGSSQ
jgi:rubrerythrin